MPHLEENDPAYYCDPQMPAWKKARVSKKLSDPSYVIEKEYGFCLRRNRMHLRKSHNPFHRRPSLSEFEVCDSLCDATVGRGFQTPRSERPQRRDGEEMLHQNMHPARIRQRPA